MSEYDKLTGVRKLRVKGKQAVRFYTKMKSFRVEHVAGSQGTKGQGNVPYG